MTAERPLEARQRPHDEGVDVLRVEARVAQQPIVVAIRERVVPGVAEVGRRVDHVVRAVVIDDAHAVAARARIELLGGYRDARSQDLPAPVAHGRVLANDGQRARAHVVGRSHAVMLPR